MEQEGPESKRQRTVGGLPVCSLLIPVDEIPVSYVATHEIDDRPVYDHRTGERLSSHLVKVGRQTEHDAMTRHQLFERVPITMARGKKSDVNGLMSCKREEMDRSCAADSLRWKWPMVYDLIHSLALHLSNASRSSSQGLRQSRTREEDTHVCLHFTTSALRSGMHCCQRTSRSRCTRRVVKKKQDTCGN